MCWKCTGHKRDDTMLVRPFDRIFEGGQHIGDILLARTCRSRGRR
jgi:hypothetical protein